MESNPTPAGETQLPSDHLSGASTGGHYKAGEIQAVAEPVSTDDRAYLAERAVHYGRNLREILEGTSVDYLVTTCVAMLANRDNAERHMRALIDTLREQLDARDCSKCDIGAEQMRRLYASGYMRTSGFCSSAPATPPNHPQESKT